MADPKIKVGADMSAVEKELGRLDTAAKKVVDTLTGSSVGLDVKQAKADLENLEQVASSVAKALQGMGEVKGGDVSKIADKLAIAAEAGEQLEKVLAAVGQSTGFGQSIRGSKAIADNLERARRAQEILTKEGTKLTAEQAKAAKAKFDEWRTSGARGTSKLKGMEFDEFVGGGWRKHSIDPAEAERNRRKVLESLGIKPGGNMEEARQGFRGRGWGAVGGAVGGAAGSLLNGGDGFFSGLGSAGGSALGMIAGAATLNPVVGAVVGSVGSKVLGAFGGMLDQSLQRVMKDAINLTDLRHSIGETSTDFNEMRSHIRAFTADLRLTNEEASALARTFSDQVGRSLDSRELAGGMRLGAGFSRGFGMDPSMGVAFIGNMRRMGQEGDSRLALKIAEAVTKNGISPQMGSVLQSLQGFVDNQTRLSFTKANADGYASFMSSMLGSSLAGSKDVGTVSSAMGAADAAMRQGGAFGEASKAFMLGTYQRKLPGFNVFDLDYMKEQGAFGTIAGAFGKDSAAYKMAQLRGDRGAMARYARYAARGGNQTVLSMQMQGLEQFYGGNTDELHKAIMGHFGVGAGGATALYDAYKSKGGLGGLEKQLRAAGVDVSGILPQQIAALAQVAGMDNKGIKAQAAKLLGDSSLHLDEKETAALQSASVEEQRKAVLKITALHDTQKDEGETLDQINKTMTRQIDAMTTQLIPAVNSIKSFMMQLVQHFMPNMAILDGPAGTTKIDPKHFSNGQKFIMNKIDAAAEKYAPGDVGYRNYLRGLAWQETQFRNISGTPTKTGDVARGPMQIMQSRINAERIDMSDMGIDYAARVNYADYKKYGVQGAARKWFTGTPKPTHRKDINGRDAMDYGTMVEANSNGFAAVDRAASINNSVRDAAGRVLLATNPLLAPAASLLPDVYHPTIPSPANQGGSTTVKLPPLDHTITVRIVDDKTGKEVKTKVAGPLPAGTHVEVVR